MHSLAQRVAVTNTLLAREIEAEFLRLENKIRELNRELKEAYRGAVDYEQAVQ